MCTRGKLYSQTEHTFTCTTSSAEKQPEAYARIATHNNLNELSSINASMARQGAHAEKVQPGTTVAGGTIVVRLETQTCAALQAGRLARGLLTTPCEQHRLQRRTARAHDMQELCITCIRKHS